MIKNIFPLSFIVATRFFGLFIVLPVMSIEVTKLHGATLFLAGFSVGIYALFQMILCHLAILAINLVAKR